MPTSIGMFILGYVVIVVSFNNCSGVHQGSSNLNSFSTCNLILKDEFLTDYYPFIKNNCNGCHTTSGSGNGAFGDPDADIAFDAFLLRGNDLIGSRAIDSNHQPPYTGPQHRGQIDEFDDIWNTTKIQVDRCLEAAGLSSTAVITNGIIPDDPIPKKGTVQTYLKVMNANQTQKTLTWRLGNEIKTPGFSFPNAELSIDVIANTTVTGEKSYIFSNPKLKAGDTSLHIMYIDFIINNVLVPSATSYHIVNRRVPMGQTRDLGVGSITFGYDLKNTDSVALSIGLIETIQFSPPTFAQLIAPTGVFGANCLSCHDTATARGGFDISTRALVMQQLKVSPYNPNNSEIFIRMNSASRPMPQPGLLPASDVNQILQWIQDGAR